MTNLAELHGFPRYSLIGVLGGILESFDRFSPGDYDQQEIQQSLLSIKLYLNDSNSHLESQLPSSINESLSLIGLAISLAEIEVSVYDNSEREIYMSLLNFLIQLKGSFGKTVRAKQSERIRGLYVIIDPQVTKGRDPLDIARGAIRGGARIIQLRDKLRDKGEIIPLAIELKKLCQEQRQILLV